MVKVMASHAMTGSWTAHQSYSLCPKAKRRTESLLEPQNINSNTCVSCCQDIAAVSGPRQKVVFRRRLFVQRDRSEQRGGDKRWEG